MSISDDLHRLQQEIDANERRSRMADHPFTRQMIWGLRSLLDPNAQEAYIYEMSQTQNPGENTYLNDSLRAVYDNLARELDVTPLEAHQQLAHQGLKRLDEIRRANETNNVRPLRSAACHK